MPLVRRFPTIVSAVLLVSPLFLAACGTTEPVSARELASVDEPLPVLEGATLDGGTFGPMDYEGRPMVVNAWASWCYPCREEQPMLDQMYEKYGEDVVFVGVNSKDTDAAAKEHAREFAIPYPSIVDADGSIAIKDLGIDTGLPGTVVVDATGQVRYRVKGRITQDLLEPMIQDITRPAA